MRHASKIGSMVFAVAVVAAAIIAGCTSAPLRTETSTSGIRAAEEAGAGKVPQASLHLQLAKEELDRAKELSSIGEKEKAELYVARKHHKETLCFLHEWAHTLGHPHG